MVELILFILGSIGITHIIVDSKIFLPLREWFKSKDNWFCNKVYEVLTCHQCGGCWVGALFGWLVFGSLLSIPLCAGATSILSMFVAMLLDLIAAKTIIKLEETNG